MPKEEKPKVEADLINEFEEIKKRLNIVRKVVDDVLEAAENGLKQLRE